MSFFSNSILTRHVAWDFNLGHSEACIRYEIVFTLAIRRKSKVGLSFVIISAVATMNAFQGQDHVIEESKPAPSGKAIVLALPTETCQLPFP